MKEWIIRWGFLFLFFDQKQYKNVAHHTIYFGKSYEKHLKKFSKKSFIRRYKLLFTSTISN